jgi:FAD:protein FMN transferase
MGKQANRRVPARTDSGVTRSRRPVSQQQKTKKEEGRGEGWVLIEEQHTIMATSTSLHVSVPPAGGVEARAAIASCVSWLREVDACLTRFQSQSELCRLNSAAGSWVAVSPLLLEMLEESLVAASESDGLFDPTLLSLLEALGYDRDFKAIAHRETRGSPVVEWRVPHRSPLTGAWRRIQLDTRRRRVRLPLGARLDFGGIAKGWAADRALDHFFGGIPDVLINIGGDMRARGGPPDGTPWPIGVGSTARQADHPETVDTVITLGSGGLATSGAADRWWYRAGERQHHLLDPRTGLPARLWIDAEDTTDSADGSSGRSVMLAAATALAPTAAHAEVAAKVALLRGYPAAVEMVDAAWESEVEGASSGSAAPDAGRLSPYGDAGVALLLTLPTGEVVCTQNLPHYLSTLGGGGNVWLS